MFIYLSKKIAIPNCSKVQHVAWNNEQGWIACCGDNGLLKVLKLENAQTGTSATQPGASQVQGAIERKGSETALSPGSAQTNASSNPSPLSMNQTLEGHSGPVQLAIWNRYHHKLTTSDGNGLIIVWILYKGVWYEEMINNRNKSVVASMQWNRDGQKICIAYQDGAVILGSVDGNRIWGKEIKNTQLAHVAWSPDSRFILFATSNGELQLYDHLGSFLSKIPNYCNFGGSANKVEALDWYDGSMGYLEEGVPCLAVAYDSGKIQILRNEKDTNPVLIDTGMKSLCMKWNPNGTLLAISGIQTTRNSQGDEKETCVLQFWTPFGKFVKSLKVPGKSISSISWETDGLRIALSVDSFIYFANLRPDYKWSFFAQDVLVYAFTKFDRPESTVVFWNTRSNEKHIRFIGRLSLITSAGEHCLIVTKSDQDENQWALTVYNAIGVSLETKCIDFEPRFALVSKSNVFVASEDIILHWQFKTLANTKMSALDAIRRRDLKERAFHIDDISVVGTGDTGQSVAELKLRPKTTDPIISITASENMLLVARQSGSLYQYLIPSVTLDNKYQLGFQPINMRLNSDATKVTLLDSNGVLKMYELERKGVLSQNGQEGPSIEGRKMVDFERKDVWDVCWAQDDPELFAIMEKTRLFIIRGTVAEDPVNSLGYICGFEALRVKTILLDDVMKDPESTITNGIIHLDTKGLRDLKNILNEKGLGEAMQYAEERSIVNLWRLIAERALEMLDFDVAHKAFVRSQDVHGLQFIKRLKKFDDAAKQKAEIALFCNRLDDAERLYLEMDRKDLAIEMRIRAGDWFRVVQLIKTGGLTDDAVLERTWSQIGDYYFDRHKWAQASTYYLQGRNYDKLAECFYILEDYEGLSKIVSNVSDSNPLLRNLAEKLSSVGLCDQSISASLKLGDIPSAINTCVALNQWTTAIELAEIHRFKDVDGLLSKYASHLLMQGKKLEAVELYRKANMCQKSSKLLFGMAREAMKMSQNPMTIKKLFVLAALEVERYHSLNKSGKGFKHQEKTVTALDGLLTEDSENVGDMDNHWRGAEAYHYYILAQRQLYEGNLDGAVITAMHLRDYEDIIDPKVIYSLLSLTTFYGKRLNMCSKAFIKLESLPNVSDEEREQYEQLSFSIFTKHKPIDPKGDSVNCSNCMAKIKSSDSFCSHCRISFPTCIASGRPIIDSIHFMCHVCKHRATETEISGLSSCPLCHASL